MGPSQGQDGQNSMEPWGHEVMEQPLWPAVAVGVGRPGGRAAERRGTGPEERPGRGAWQAGLEGEITRDAWSRDRWQARRVAVAWGLHRKSACCSSQQAPSSQEQA